MRKFKLQCIAAIAIAAAASSCSSGESAEAAGEGVQDAAEPAEAAEPQAGAPYVPARQVADIPIERVAFDDAGKTTVIEDSITGYASVDYVVRVDSGEAMSVVMDTSNTAAYFNIIAPGETDVAFHIGSSDGNRYSGTANSSGDYRIRVYMMRSAARREETAFYTLEIAVGAD